LHLTVEFLQFFLWFFMAQKFLLSFLYSWLSVPLKFVSKNELATIFIPLGCVFKAQRFQMFFISQYQSSNDLKIESRENHRSNHMRTTSRIFLGFPSKSAFNQISRGASTFLP